MFIYWFITSIPHFIVLCFVAFHRLCSFYKLNFCGKPVSSKLTGTIFPIGHIYFLFLYHILVIFAVFQAFSLVCYDGPWLEIFDVVVAIILGQPKKMANLIHKWCVLATPQTGIFLTLSFSSGLPNPSDTTILKLGQLITLQWLLRVQVKARIAWFSL